jgi:hypothetical protein
MGKISRLSALLITAWHRQAQMAIDAEATAKDFALMHQLGLTASGILVPTAHFTPSPVS